METGTARPPAAKSPGIRPALEGCRAAAQQRQRGTSRLRRAGGGESCASQEEHTPPAPLRFPPPAARRATGSRKQRAAGHPDTCRKSHRTQQAPPVPACCKQGHQVSCPEPDRGEPPSQPGRDSSSKQPCAFGEGRQHLGSRRGRGPGPQVGARLCRGQGGGVNSPPGLKGRDRDWPACLCSAQARLL